MRSEPRGKSGMGSARGGAVKCGKERQDAAVGAEIATVNSCGDQRGVSELRIGAANRHKQPTRRRLQKGLRRWSARESARRFARGIGAENCAGICVRNLRQEFASGICVRRLALKFAGGGLPGGWRGGAEKGKGGDRYKKRPRKNRGHTVELNFRAEVSAATHIGWTKQSSFFHRLQDPKFRLSRHRVRGTVVRQTPALVSPPGYNLPSSFGPPAPCFDPKRLPWFRPRVPTS